LIVKYLNCSRLLPSLSSNPIQTVSSTKLVQSYAKFQLVYFMLSIFYIMKAASKRRQAGVNH